MKRSTSLRRLFSVMLAWVTRCWLGRAGSISSLRSSPLVRACSAAFGAAKRLFHQSTWESLETQMELESQAIARSGVTKTSRVIMLTVRSTEGEVVRSLEAEYRDTLGSDRLDELDSIIQGKGVLDLMQFRVPHAVGDQGAVTVEVKFDNVLGEARQQQNVLRQLLVTLTAAAESAKGAASPPAASSASPVDEFTKRRQGRGA